MKRILLIYPGVFKVKDLNLPLPLLMLARVLLEKGYHPEILDCRVKDYRKINLSDLLYVGITTMSGNQLAYALEVAKFIRKKNSTVPLIWGGPHPTLVPEETAQNPYVDIAVRGEGEETLLELTQKIEKGESVEKVKGITFRKDGKIVSTPARNFLDINKVAHLPYHLVDTNCYPLEYSFEYLSSKGCPHNCGFCSNVANSGRTWRPKSPEVVIAELEYIMERFAPKRIGFIDANFFVSRKRVERICELIIEKGWDVDFYTMCRCDYFDKFSSSFIKLLKRARINELALGAESGSNRVLKFMGKGFKTHTIIGVTEKCKKAGLTPIFSFMAGIPTETRDEFYKTLDLYDRILTINPHAIINGIFLFTPFPRTPLTDLAIEKFGYSPPTSLEGWKNWNWSDRSHIVWANKVQKEEYEVVSILSRFFYLKKLMQFWTPEQEKVRVKSPVVRLVLKVVMLIFSISAYFRWKYRFFRYGVEWRIWERLLERFGGRR